MTNKCTQGEQFNIIIYELVCDSLNECPQRVPRSQHRCRTPTAVTNDQAGEQYDTARRRRGVQQLWASANGGRAGFALEPPRYRACNVEMPE